MDLERFNPAPPKRCPLGVDVVPKVHAASIESIVMAMSIPTFIPLLLMGLIGPAFLELSGNKVPGLDMLGYLLVAMMIPAMLYTTLSMGRPFAPLSKTLREFHESMADTRKAPASVVVSYQLVKELPEVSRLLEASLDEAWVLKQAPSLELLELGKQARKIQDKAQDLRFAHLTAEIPLALGPSTQAEPILDYTKTSVSELDEYISVVNQALR